MLKIDRLTKQFERLKEPDLKGVDLSERYGLQAMIRANPNAFFEELGEELLLVNEEVRPSDVVDDRIDLLALDTSGSAVVIELKRGSHKLQLLQALAYAGMVARWPAARLVEERRKFCNCTAEQAEDEFRQFLAEDSETLNEAQRVILIAEDFDFEVLVAAEWLHGKHGVDIRCYRLALSVDGANEYASCACIYPPAELADHAVRRSRGPVSPLKWSDWEAALQQIANPAVVAFFKMELAGGRDCYLRKRILRYKLDGRRRWWMSARRDFAYTWQNGRFDGDLGFWSNRLGADADVAPVKQGTCLRFFLSSAKQFDAFLKGTMEEIKPQAFLDLLESSAEAEAAEQPEPAFDPTVPASMPLA
jgi:hypothetical protein